MATNTLATEINTFDPFTQCPDHGCARHRCDADHDLLTLVDDSPTTDNAPAPAPALVGPNMTAESLAPNVDPNTFTTRDGLAIAVLNHRVRAADIVTRGGDMTEGRVVGRTVEWDGRGERTRADLLAVLRACEAPEDWAPSVKDAAPTLTDAIMRVIGQRYNRETVPKPRDEDGRYLRGAEHSWTSRHAVVSGSTDSEIRPGETWGTTVLVVTLWEPKREVIGPDGAVITERGAPRLEFTSGRENTAQDGAPEDQAIREHRANLAGLVLAEFEARLASERYVAANVTLWLQNLITQTLGGSRLGKGYYVPSDTAEIARNIAKTLQKSGWGENWTWLKTITGEDLSEGMELSLFRSVDALARALDNDRVKARAANRLDIGERACDGWRGRFQALSTEINKVAHLMTQDGLKHVRDHIADAVITLDEIAMMWAATSAPVASSALVASTPAPVAPIADPGTGATWTRVETSAGSAPTPVGVDPAIRPLGRWCHVRKYNEEGVRVNGWTIAPIRAGDAVQVAIGNGDHTLVSVRTVMWSDVGGGDYVLRIDNARPRYA